VVVFWGIALMPNRLDADNRGAGIGRNVDDSTIATGDRNKINNDRVSASSNPNVAVNNYLGDNRGQTTDERLDRVEVAMNQTQRTLARVVALMDGDPSYRIIGMPDQLAAYIKANEDWKEATKQRILNNDERLSALEKNNNPIVITRTTLVFMLILGTLCLVAAFLILSWLGGAG
jgi:hypothetical protein